MQQILAKLYEGIDLSGAVSGVIYLPVSDSRLLTAIKVKTDENVSGADAVFALKKNGVVITGAEAVTISVGTKSGTVSSLAIALADGDELLLDMVSGAISSPVSLFLTTTKTVNTDELTEVTDKKFVTDAEKTKLSNLSGTNSGDETTVTVGALINGASAATPNNADLVATVESSVVKKITWTNVKAFLKTYFDTLYQVGLISGTNIKTINSTSLLGSGDIPLSDAAISTTDITTNNASTSKHGFLKKLDNDATHFLNGQGNWTTPSGGSADINFASLFGGGLRYWIAARKIAAISDASSVATIPNFGSLNDYFSQGSAAPTFETNEVNSLPTFRGGTSNKKWASRQTFTTFRDGSDHGFGFIVGKVNTPPGTSYAGGFFGDGGSENLDITVSNGNPSGLIAIEKFSGSLLRATASYTVGSWMVVEFRWNATTMYIRVNGGTESSVTATVSTNAAALNLFAWNTSGNYLDCDIAEFLLGNVPLASGDMTIIRNELGRVYNISV